MGIRTVRKYLLKIPEKLSKRTTNRYDDVFLCVADQFIITLANNFGSNVSTLLAIREVFDRHGIEFAYPTPSLFVDIQNPKETVGNGSKRIVEW